jgi:hypothetical protein
LDDFEQKRAEKDPNFIKIVFPPHILSNSREVKEISPLTQTKIVFFGPKFLQKVKITGDRIFSFKRPNFSSGLAEKFCKELATLGASVNNSIQP